MRGIDIADLSPSTRAEGYAAPGVRLAGRARGTLFAPEGLSLWLAAADVEAGSELTWEGDHGDEAVYVSSGAVEVDGRVCPAGGSMIVEAGADARIRFPEPATVLHFGPHDAGPPDGAEGHGTGRQVHVVGPRGTYATRTAERDTHFYADTTCETCRITLFFTGRSQPHDTPPHSHSQDEILYVVEGSIRFGRREVPPGSAVAVWADRRYAFKSGPDGFGMLNYRRDASYFSSPGGGEPFLEGGRATGMELVGDVIL